MRDLLLLLCRYPFEEKNRELLTKLLREVLDWPKTVNLINDHGIIALAAYNIKEAGLEKEIPEDAMAILESGYMKSVVRNTWLTERWKEVNTILSNAGIKHVLLKGMALEHTLYGSRGLRQMTDNDILIKRDEAIRAWNLLKQNGFSHQQIKSPLHEKIMPDIGKHLPSLFRNGYAVEIHHKLSDTDNKKKWSSCDPIEEAVEISIGETKAWILPGEMQLMYLTDHFERHAMEGSCQLRIYNDIRLLDNNSNVHMPDHFISEPFQENKPEYRRATYKINIRSIPAKYRLRYLTGDIFPTVDWMRDRYNCSAWKTVLYYPRRIGKLLWLL